MVNPLQSELRFYNRRWFKVLIVILILQFILVSIGIGFVFVYKNFRSKSLDQDNASSFEDSDNSTEANIEQEIKPLPPTTCIKSGQHKCKCYDTEFDVLIDGESV